MVNFVLATGQETTSWAQNSGAVGNGVHFFLKMDSNVEFDADSDGADRFSKKGAQNAHFGPNRGPDGFLRPF